MPKLFIRYPDDLPEVYVPALYVSEEGILQIDDTAVVDGISYHVERVEYTLSPSYSLTM